MLEGVANHPHGAAGVSLAEHHARRAGVDDRLDGSRATSSGRRGDVRGVDQSEPAATLLHALDRLHGAARPFGDG